MSDTIANGPAEFEMQVMVVNDDTGQSGRVTIGLGVFEYPTPAKVQERIELFENTELEGALEGFRLMTREEAFTNLIYERTGEHMVTAGPKEWDDIPQTVASEKGKER